MKTVSRTAYYDFIEAKRNLARHISVSFRMLREVSNIPDGERVEEKVYIGKLKIAQSLVRYDIGHYTIIEDH